MSSRQKRRFHASSTFLNRNSMIQYTLAPLYKRSTTVDISSMAVMAYGGDFSDLPASTSSGILFGNSLGGVWISHTLPGFPNLTMRGPPLISEKDYDKGHMIMCLRLNLMTLNKIAAVVKHTEFKITDFSLPQSLRSSLLEWARIERDPSQRGINPSQTKLLNFSTRNKLLQGKILVRGADDSRNLYHTFAKMQRIVLDVYNSNYEYPKPTCQRVYSLRYMEKISINFPEQKVCYIPRKNDKTSFGVSTGAVWQRSGRNSAQYWTCIGDHDRHGYLAKGGLLTCAEDYSLWFGFDNFKTKEPEC
ncbi:unnamed protein product [Arctia plantaginis]|uniref:Plancitoxin-1 n=1 Tax=Arctia plantaginis TaxID=874455 RepID=A0A8S1B7Q2_ARCPL|nr:unnamed protein product [Arctia plantaginis]